MGRLIIVTGPTASGKDAVMHQLLKQNPHFQRIITATTRAPREIERDGIDYHFIPLNDFNLMKDQGQLLETNRYGGNWYGTPKSEFKKVHDSHTTIWRVDPTMAGRARLFFKDSFPEEEAEILISKTLVIYLDCPNDILHTRLKERGMSEEEIAKRMEQDKDNWDTYKDSFDFVVKSDGEVEHTTSKVLEIIERKGS